VDVDPASGRVVVRTSARELSVYAAPSLETVDSFVFPDKIAFVRLGAGGKELLVLTAAQTIYTLNVGR
jgi:hypothetical protein